MAQNTARIVYHDSYEGKGFTDENSLARMLLTRPDQIDGVITHLLGKESARLPLSFLSEGQSGGSIPVKDIQVEYDVVNRLNRPDVVISTPYSGSDKPGINVGIFYVTFKTNWFKYQHTIVSENGVRARIVDRPVNDGPYWKFALQLITNDRTAFCPLADLAVGSRWVMSGGANVAQSRSEGNESNVVSPGKMKNQLSILRKSYRIAGNISNKVVECQFDIDGKKTNLWMPWEQWQHITNWKVDLEEHLWDSVYNRLPDGTILNRDLKTGEPIPTMAGLLDQIPNRDTYGFLTAKKIKNTVRDVLYGATDAGVMDVVLFTGTGGAEEFDRAMKDEASGFTQIIGDKFITGAGRNLVLGGYFNQYQHVDGHVVTLKKLPLLDHGNRSLAARPHPVTGLPITSYEMYFVDLSTYDGKRNLVMLHEKGRSMKTGILRGMADTPMDFGGNAEVINLATERDESSIHFLTSKGLILRRNTHSFVLTCDLT